MILRRGAVLAWRLVQTGCSDHLLWLWDVEGPTGATSQLGYGEFCKAGQGDRLTWCLKRLKL